MFDCPIQGVVGDLFPAVLAEREVRSTGELLVLGDSPGLALSLGHLAIDRRRDDVVGSAPDHQLSDILELVCRDQDDAERRVLRDQRSRKHESILTCQLDIDERDVGLRVFRNRERVVARPRARRHGHALRLEQRARRDEERLTVVDDETSIHHIPSIQQCRRVRNAATWTIDRPASSTEIGPPAAATRAAARVIVTGMLATETSPATRPGAAPAKRSEDARRLKTSDRVLIERALRGFELLQGKWKVDLIVAIARGIRRPRRLHTCLAGISKKVMTDCLRGLERDGLATRQIYAQVPARVEYSLTPLGWTITDAIVSLSEWSKQHSADVTRARTEYWLRQSETDEILRSGRSA